MSQSHSSPSRGFPHAVPLTLSFSRPVHLFLSCFGFNGARPAAVWLFGSGLLGLIGFARKKKK